MADDKDAQPPIPFAAFDGVLTNDAQVPLQIVSSKEAVEGTQLQGETPSSNSPDPEPAQSLSSPVKKPKKPHNKHKHKNKHKHNQINLDQDKQRSQSRSKHKNSKSDNDDHDSGYKYNKKPHVEQYYTIQCVGGIATILILISMIMDEMSQSRFTIKEFKKGVYFYCGAGSIYLFDDRDMDEQVKVTDDVDISELHQQTYYYKCMNYDEYCQALNIVGPIWMTFSILSFITVLFSILTLCCSRLDDSIECIKLINKYSIRSLVLTIILQIIVIIICASTPCTMEPYEKYTREQISIATILMIVAVGFTCIEFYLLYKIIKKISLPYSQH